jgi:hypothetical protein
VSESQAKEIRRLRRALTDALEGLEEMASYVPEYFAQKWDHADYIKRAKEALVDTHPSKESA